MAEPREARRLAIVAFFPDWGHVQPLMRIAAAARSAGFQVRCFVPEQARPLVEQQGLTADYFPGGSSPATMAEFRKLGRRSTFFREFSGHAHHNLLIVPEAIEAIGKALPDFVQHIRAFGPDLLISDFAVFGEHYKRIAASLGVPLLKHHGSYGLGALHRTYVQVYGLGDASPARMAGVELLGRGFRLLYRRGYYLAHARRYLRLRRLKQRFEAEFARSFPVPAGRQAATTEIMSVIGWMERHFLRGPVPLPPDFVTFPPPPLASQDLSPDVEDWLAASPAKAIYVSFGSMVSLGDRHRALLYRKLKSFGCRIIWSAPREEAAQLARLANGDPDVLVTSYVAQAALLRRPEVACFVTHGGANGAVEAWLGGTPVLCIPFFTDQPYIASLIEELGTGFRLWKQQIGSAAFEDRMNRILAGELDARVAEVAAELARFEQADELKQFLLRTIAGSGERPA